MTTDTGVSSGSATQTKEDVKQSDKELNFARLRAERDGYAQASAQLGQELSQLRGEIDTLKRGTKSPEPEEEEDADESYVDSRKLKKTLSKWEKNIEQKIERKAEEKAKAAVEKERNENFIYRLKAEYGDFDQVLSKETANKLEEAHPELAKQILSIPDEYQKRKTAYETIRALGLHKPKEEEQPKTNIQDRVNSNIRSQAYTSASAGNNSMTEGTTDYSERGQEAAYKKMQELKKRLGYAR